MFSQVCLFKVWEGVPRHRSEGGIPHPGLHWGGGTPSQVLVGGTPSQVWMGGTPGNPHHDWMGYPPGQVWMLEGGYHQVPPHHDWMGYPPPRPGLDGRGDGTPGTPPTMIGWGTPPPSSSTCYASGGVPLAFTQEDFLVLSGFCFRQTRRKYRARRISEIIDLQYTRRSMSRSYV